VTADLSGPLVLVIPLIVAILSALAWILWSRPVEPPRFRGYAVRQGWQVDPMARLDRDLRQGRLTSGIVAVRDILLLELAARYHLSPTQVRRSTPFARPRRGPGVDRACRVVRSLEATYTIASLVEDPRRTDLWSRWRRPAWRALARRRFEEELSAVESLWPALGAAS